MTEAHDLEVAAAEAQPLRHGHILKTLLRVGLSVVALVVAALVLQAGLRGSRPGHRPPRHRLAQRRRVGGVPGRVRGGHLGQRASSPPRSCRSCPSAAASPRTSARARCRARSPVRATSPFGSSCTARGATRRPSSTVSVAASGMVTVGTKLVLPAVAAVPLFFTGRLTGDTGRFAVIGATIAIDGHRGRRCWHCSGPASRPAPGNGWSGSSEPSCAGSGDRARGPRRPSGRGPPAGHRPAGPPLADGAPGDGPVDAAPACCCWSWRCASSVCPAT